MDTKAAERVQAKKSGKLKIWIPALLAVFLTCLFPCISIFAQNAGEARPIDMLPFLGIFSATAAVGLIVAGILLRDISRAGFMTCLGMLVVINFNLLADWVEKHFPWFYSKYQMVVICIILLLILILLLRKKPNMQPWCLILAIAFGALCIMNVIIAVPQMIKAAEYSEHGEEEHMEDAPAEDMESFTGEKRNVYYLLFDEYGGEDNLEYYFGYDNSSFYEALEERGFSVSKSTRNTESAWTDTLIPNLLNLEYYCSDDMPELARRSYLENPYLYRLFHSNGYVINLINHRKYLSEEGTNVLSKGQEEDSISQYLLERSLYNKISYLRTKINTLLFINYRDNYVGPVSNCLETLENCTDYLASDALTLTISYIQCPHAPFVFDSEGNVIDFKTNGWNWKNKNLYPDQLQYVNTCILTAIDNIQAADPDAVILLFSDHGARYSLHMVEQYGGPRFDSEEETPYMQNALCAVCVPGQSLEIEGMTVINATRTALNAAFGTDLQQLDAPEGYVLPEANNAPVDWQEGDGGGLQKTQKDNREKD